MIVFVRLHSESTLWTPNSKSIADNMLFTTLDTRPVINPNIPDFNEPKIVKSEVFAVHKEQEDYQNSQWNGGVEDIDLLTSPKFQMTVPKKEQPDGLLDLECLYYDQFEYNSSPEIISPKKESFESSIGSQIYVNESRSTDSMTYTNLQGYNRSQSHISYASEPSLESVIDDAFALESSFGYSSINSSPIPNVCEWIDCFSVFKTQEELVRSSWIRPKIFLRYKFVVYL